MDEVSARLVELHGGDPFAAVRERSESHQRAHGCGLHHAGPSVMQHVAHVARLSSARRVADLGCGLGYSTLWLANAVGDGGEVIAIDSDDGHVEEARRLATDHGLAERVTFVHGHTDDVVATLDGPFDLVHDDAWFAHRPEHLDAVIELLRPGGVLTMANWFLLVDAISGRPRNDWAAFAGPNWAEDTKRYAEHLSERGDVTVNWTIDPPVGIAMKERLVR